MKKMLMEEKTTTTTRTVRPAASSATRELDDLMASLSDIKVSDFDYYAYRANQKSDRVIEGNGLLHVR